MYLPTESVQICVCQECDIVFRSNELIRCPHCAQTAIITLDTIDEMYNNLYTHEATSIWDEIGCISSECVQPLILPSPYNKYDSHANS
jgi:hypothetical protein